MICRRGRKPALLTALCHMSLGLVILTERLSKLSVAASSKGKGEPQGWFSDLRITLTESCVACIGSRDEMRVLALGWALFSLRPMCQCPERGSQEQW